MLEAKLFDETTFREKLHSSLCNVNDYAMHNYRKYTRPDGENIVVLIEDDIYYDYCKLKSQISGRV